MNKKLDIYFDYRSPFPYLALEEAYRLASQCHAEIEWKPIRLPLLSSYRERPMNSAFPKKLAYIAKDCQRWARRRNVVINPPSSFREASAPCWERTIRLTRKQH